MGTVKRQIADSQRMGRRNNRQVLECGDGACAVAPFGLKRVRLDWTPASGHAGAKAVTPLCCVTALQDARARMGGEGRSSILFELVQHWLAWFCSAQHRHSARMFCWDQKSGRTGNLVISTEPLGKATIEASAVWMRNALSCASPHPVTQRKIW